MKKERVGTFRITENQRRVRYAECPKYDEVREVKAGDYPVYLNREDEGAKSADTVSIVFDDDFSEVWHGFMMAKSDSFIPDDGWEVVRYTFKSWAEDAHDIETGAIVRSYAVNDYRDLIIGR